MAVLLLGAVGAGIGGAIGGTFLGMSAASIGWMVGSSLGSVFGQKDQQISGPRLGDLSVQSSTYGAAVPYVAGASRVSGNVIWSTSKREVSTTTEVGGKGGPSVENTTYTYNVDIAIALCEGPIAGIGRIWSNGELVYDARSDAALESILGSQLKMRGFKVYTGTEAQLPDPTIEAALGAGNVPAYRGLAYIVFERLDCPGGQIPQLSFEVIVTGSTAPRVRTFPSGISAPGGGSTTYSGCAVSKKRVVYWRGPAWAGSPSGGKASSWELKSSGPRALPGATIPGDLLLGYPVNLNGHPKPSFLQILRDTLTFEPHTSVSVDRVDLLTGEVSNVVTWRYDISNRHDAMWSAGGLLGEPTASFDPVKKRYYLIAGPGTSDRTIAILSSGGSPDYTLPMPTAPMGIAAYNGAVWVLGDVGGVLVAWRLIGLASYATVAGPETASPWAVRKIIAHAGGVFVLLGAASGLHRLYRVSDDGWALVGSFTADVSPGADTLGPYSNFWTDGRIVVAGWFVSTGSNPTAMVVDLEGIAVTPPPVGDVIADLCQRGGMAPGLVDASACTAPLLGYQQARVGTVRSAIDPLILGYAVDMGERDGVLHFWPRSTATSAATIAWGELGASEEGSNPAADPLPLTVQQESELPRSIAVNYISGEDDYQPGTATARRILTSSVNDPVLDVPIVLAPDHAQSIAATVLYDAWTARNARSASLLRQWAWLDAGDVVTLEESPGQFGAWRLTKVQDDGRTIAVSLLPSNAQAMLPQGYGAGSAAGQQTVSALPDSDLVLLDLPLLRDADASAGIGLYAALARQTGWPGAVIYGGPNNTNLTRITATSGGTVVGHAVTVLADWTSNTVDTTHTVDVQINDGTLDSHTRDAVLDDQAGAVLLGDELLQYTTAISLGGGVWRLGGLVRGQRGTEWARSTHAEGELFVLLKAAGMSVLPLEPQHIGTPRTYKAVTFGLTMADADDADFISTGQAARPLSPVALRRTNSPAPGDIAIAWDRRTRASRDFPSGGVDLPLFEASEAYEVEIFADGTYASVLRTLATSTPAATYTAAQQTADFGAPQPAVHLRVYQLGAIGRGRAAQAYL